MFEKPIDRRSALKGIAAAGAGAAAGAVLAGSAQAEEAGGEGASGGKWSWSEKPAPVTDIARTVDADIVVVGGGIAGVSAAQSAAEEGLSVVLLEKTSQCNGRGLDIGNMGSKWFQEHPELSQYHDASDAERTYYEFSHCYVNRLLFRYWAQHSGEAYDHLSDYMTEKYGYEVNLSATVNASQYEARDYYRELPTCLQFGTGWFDEDGNWWMQGVVNKVAQWAQDLGATFMFDSPAEQLVQDEDGRVTGVIASTAEGHVQVNAAKGVILACGDIGGNPEMLEAWCPVALRTGADVYNPAGANTGDGVKMGLWAGADVQHGPAAPMIHPMGAGGPLAQGGEQLGFLCVNRNGERYSCEVNNTPGMANSRLVQPGGISYTIFDGGYAEKALTVRPDNVSISGGKIIDDTTQETIDQAVEAGEYCFRADTVEELAEQIGADPETLAATVERWNELCAQGSDPDMCLDAAHLTTLDTPPYYASFNPQANMVIIFGLNCDSHSRVCDADDKPIEGLYAIGNTQGNFFAVDYPLICPGISHGRCVTFGYELPKAIARGELL